MIYESQFYATFLKIKKKKEKEKETQRKCSKLAKFQLENLKKVIKMLQKDRSVREREREKQKFFLP